VPKYPYDIFRKNRRNRRSGPADTRSWRRNRRPRLGTIFMRKKVSKISNLPLERSGEHPALQLAPLPQVKEPKTSKKPDPQINAGFYILPR
jgi:hypothetical protein